MTAIHGSRDGVGPAVKARQRGTDTINPVYYTEALLR